MSKQSSTGSNSLSTNTLILLGIAWALVALLFFLFFSVPPPGETQPDWYFVGITVLETGAFILSGIVCLRNWRSSQIVSGRGVWLLIGLGLISFAMGNILFYIWGNVWELEPDVSLGDIFYLLSYVFLAGGMLRAVLPRRLDLDLRQFALIAVIGLVGIALAFIFNYVLVGEEIATLSSSSLATSGSGGLLVAQSYAADFTLPSVSRAVVTGLSPTLAAAPAWAESLDAQLAPLAPYATLLYVLADCLLLVVAATLLVAFWGGRFSQSWKLIAVAAFCLYIADMFFAYQVNLSDYQEGSLWEVFWTFSAVFFGLGAVVEHSVSSRSRRTSRRRRTS